MSHLCLFSCLDPSFSNVLSAELSEFLEASHSDSNPDGAEGDGWENAREKPVVQQLQKWVSLQRQIKIKRPNALHTM